MGVTPGVFVGEADGVIVGVFVAAAVGVSVGCVSARPVARARFHDGLAIKDVPALLFSVRTSMQTALDDLRRSL